MIAVCFLCSKIQAAIYRCKLFPFSFDFLPTSLSSTVFSFFLSHFWSPWSFVLPVSHSFFYRSRSLNSLCFMCRVSQVSIERAFCESQPKRESFNSSRFLVPLKWQQATRQRTSHQRRQTSKYACPRSPIRRWPSRQKSTVREGHSSEHIDGNGESEGALTRRRQLNAKTRTAEKSAKKESNSRRTIRRTIEP